MSKNNKQFIFSRWVIKSSIYECQLQLTVMFLVLRWSNKNWGNCKFHRSHTLPFACNSAGKLFRPIKIIINTTKTILSGGRWKCSECVEYMIVIPNWGMLYHRLSTSSKNKASKTFYVMINSELTSRQIIIESKKNAILTHLHFILVISFWYSLIKNCPKSYQTNHYHIPALIF